MRMQTMILAVLLASGMTAARAAEQKPVVAAPAPKPVAACLNGTATPIAANPALYIRHGVKPKCSANINIFYLQNRTGVVVAVNSSKGRNTFVGSSATGKFLLHKPCNNACTAEEAASAVSEVVAAGVL